MKRYPYLVIALVLFAIAARPADDEPPDNKHGIMVRVAQIYVEPSTTSAKLALVDRGREVVVLDQSRDWVKVLADVTAEREVTGWMMNKGIVHPDTPDGDKIMFGEGAASELIASQRGGRRGAADDARRLYYRTYEYFPKSPLAGEGLYRAADIIWQVDMGDAKTRPSAKQRDPNLHAEVDDQYMKMVIKKFGGTKWADLAAFHLLEPKLCGDWEGQSKCPEKEADMYEKYAAERPNSPAAPEALYNAAWRRAALIEIYKNENKPKNIDDAKNHVKAIAQTQSSKYPDSDWAKRTRALLYMVEQGIPTWGNVVE